MRYKVVNTFDNPAPGLLASLAYSTGQSVATYTTMAIYAVVVPIIFRQLKIPTIIIQCGIQGLLLRTSTTKGAAAH